LRSGKEIGKGAPKTNEKSKETPAEKDESGIAKSKDIEKNAHSLHHSHRP
jgi:hypothetical protein